MKPNRAARRAKQRAWEQLRGLLCPQAVRTPSTRIADLALDMNNLAHHGAIAFMYAQAAPDLMDGTFATSDPEAQLIEGKLMAIDDSITFVTTLAEENAKAIEVGMPLEPFIAWKPRSVGWTESLKNATVTDLDASRLTIK